MRGQFMSWYIPLSDVLSCFSHIPSGRLMQVEVADTVEHHLAKAIFSPLVPCPKRKEVRDTISTADAWPAPAEIAFLQRPCSCKRTTKVHSRRRMYRWPVQVQVLPSMSCGPGPRRLDQNMATPSKLLHDTSLSNPKHQQAPADVCRALGDRQQCLLARWTPC